jgi:S-adenosylmethionine/arginine decarboxylase-like enzyme
MMKNIAPDIFRQRLLIEAYYTIEVTSDLVKEFLLSLAKTLQLRTYGEPIVFSPKTGMGAEDNQGFDGFVPLIDSGISIYVWSKSQFLSVVLYTCKGFNTEEALSYTKEFFQLTPEVVHQSF